MNMRGTRGLVALVCAAGMLPVLATGPASAAPTRCQGKVATIVSRDHEVTGTSGDDVIVSTGRLAVVDARGGNDTICVRGPRGLAIVAGGAGDDSVRVENRGSTLTELTSGTDTFRGGPGSDTVVTGASRGRRNADTVHLGGGDDTLLMLAAGDSRSATLEGGPGRDEVVVAAEHGGLLLDAATSSASFRGRRTAGWQGFETYAMASDGRTTFRGTDGDDSVLLVGPDSRATTLAGDDTVAVVTAAGAGDTADEEAATVEASRLGRLLGHAPRRGAATFRRLIAGARAASPFDAPVFDLDPGEGRDELVVLAEAPRVVGDLTLGTLTASTEQGTAAAQVPTAGFEDLTAYSADESATIELIGDAGDNALRASACDVVLRGGAGNDALRVGSDADATGGLLDEFSLSVLSDGGDCARTSEVHGDAGDDTLVSRRMVVDVRALITGARSRWVEGRVRDLLDGGEGTDSADAGLGIDTCVAEVVVGCEH